LDKVDRELSLFFRANYTLTNFGVLTTRGDVSYLIKIEKCQIETLDELNEGIIGEVESKPLIDFMSLPDPVTISEPTKSKDMMSGLMTLDWSEFQTVADEPDPVPDGELESDGVPEIVLPPKVNYNIKIEEEYENDEFSDDVFSSDEEVEVEEEKPQTYMDLLHDNDNDNDNDESVLDENKPLNEFNISDILRRYDI
jgi:hypothetical protein